MKYKLLKYIESEEDSIPLGSTFDASRAGFVDLDNWIALPVELLIKQGFIEEVKETPKPRWKVGDYAVKINSDRIRFIKISEVEEVYKWEFWYDWYGEYCFRNPTKEELSLYFR